DEILIVTGVDHMGDVVNLLGSGKDFGCRFTYKVQDEAGGIAQALGLAENFVGQDRVCVILGDNVFQDPIAPFVRAFREQPRGARLLLKQVHDPQRYGVAEVDGSRVVRIVEKPKNPKSDLAVVGVYFYDSDVFGIIRTLKPSARNELEITDVNNQYLRQGTLQCDRLAGWWTDAGTFESLRAANELVTGRAASAAEAERG
ncbi:MAG TPA: sugar phosphate nucleotidyltransferase, partial [Myxococcales bacterium]|nr:sugar phosphate nucleotidyltransferase [Myxococcales bacterium]